MAADGCKTVTVLGATGSVGRTTLGLIGDNPRRYRVAALTGGSNWALLAEQVRKFAPNFVAIADEDVYTPLKEALSGEPVEIAAGPAAIVAAAQRPSDWVMAGIVGLAGLSATIEAIRRGVAVAFANKECLVSSGVVMLREVLRAGATLLPVDSEHNAIFQVLEDRNRDMVDRIILTASGGPFRDCSQEEMAAKTPDEALAHPNWDMGAKISVDSATMMNKGLELIEAHHLFDMPANNIDVLIHPQSIVHSMVAYRDGSVLAQLGTPDMAIPIAHALAWPNRIPVPRARLNLVEIAALTFETPDSVRFPALRLAREVMAAGGGAPLVMNAANEVAVAGFLEGRIGFTDIVPTIEHILGTFSVPEPQSIDDVIHLDSVARQMTSEILQA